MLKLSNTRVTLKARISMAVLSSITRVKEQVGLTIVAAVRDQSKTMLMTFTVFQLAALLHLDQILP